MLWRQWADKLSYRDMAEIAWELGVLVAPCTILRWVVRYSEEFAKRWLHFEQRSDEHRPENFIHVHAA